MSTSLKLSERGGGKNGRLSEYYRLLESGLGGGVPVVCDWAMPGEKNVPTGGEREDNRQRQNEAKSHTLVIFWCQI